MILWLRCQRALAAQPLPCTMWGAGQPGRKVQWRRAHNFTTVIADAPTNSCADDFRTRGIARAWFEVCVATEQGHLRGFVSEPCVFWKTDAELLTVCMCHARRCERDNEGAARKTSVASKLGGAMHARRLDIAEGQEKPELGAPLAKTLRNSEEV